LLRLTLTINDCGLLVTLKLLLLSIVAFFQSVTSTVTGTEVVVLIVPPTCHLILVTMLPAAVYSKVSPPVFVKLPAKIVVNGTLVILSYVPFVGL
jgi:hypothetical protein